MSKVQWPTAAVIIAALAAIVILSINHVATGDLMLVILIVLGGMGFTQLNAIREQTNGTSAEQLRMIRDLSNKVAAMTPAVVPPIKATAEVERVETVVTMAPPTPDPHMAVPTTRGYP